MEQSELVDEKVQFMFGWDEAMVQESCQDVSDVIGQFFSAGALSRSSFSVGDGQC